MEGYIFFPFNAIAQDIKYEEKSSQLLLEIKERVLDVLEQLLEDTAGYEFPDELENIENMSYEQMKELYSKHVKDGSRLYKFVHRLNNKYSVVDDDRFKKVVKEYIGNGERWSDFPSEEIIDRKIDTIY